MLGRLSIVGEVAISIANAYTISRLLAYGKALYSREFIVDYRSSRNGIVLGTS